jgi:hypothetical protein
VRYGFTLKFEPKQLKYYLKEFDFGKAIPESRLSNNKKAGFKFAMRSVADQKRRLKR